MAIVAEVEQSSRDMDPVEDIDYCPADMVAAGAGNYRLEAASRESVWDRRSWNTVHT